MYTHRILYIIIIIIYYYYIGPSIVAGRPYSGTCPFIKSLSLLVISTRSPSFLSAYIGGYT